MKYYLIIIHLSIPCLNANIKHVLLKIKTKLKVVLDMMLRSKLEIYQRICVTWGLQGGGATALQNVYYLRIFLATGLKSGK
jgi:hypothetical protein